ncbi:unnamed protein product [Brassica rapa]|uniref:Uncharacterized protein n=1 Tax=Brassica campestris TaxID=3711 RepID=A0A8D9CQE7_BRACM|nr:unnamed protein product [Brassica rapa]
MDGEDKGSKLLILIFQTCLRLTIEKDNNCRLEIQEHRLEFKSLSHKYFIKWAFKQISFCPYDE